MNKVAIITVNYNGKKDTLEFLGSLKKLRIISYELRIMVIDNGSSDGSVSAIRTKYPEVDIIQAGQNLGYSGGYNKGLEYAQIWGAQLFLLLNNDCIIDSVDLVEELVKTAKSDSKIGFVSPKILFASGFEFYKNRYKESDKGKVIWFAGGKFDWDNIGSIHRGLDEVDKGQYDLVEKSEIFSGACVLIKKEVLEKIAHLTDSTSSLQASSGQGGLDEKYFLYFEDSDFAKRATDAGFKTYYNGKVSIYHKVSRSTGIGSKLTDYYHSRNRLIFGMKYGSKRTKFALLREAVKLLIDGRRAQRQGVLDYFLGIRGGNSGLHLPAHSSLSLRVHPSESKTGRHGPKGAATNLEYPLKLSIGIVNYNTSDLTKKLLQSIFAKNSGFNEKNMEVIVLDNGNTDPCKEIIGEFLPKIKYLKNEENEGFSKGYNKTIKFSLGEYYLMFNSDIEVLKNGLTELINIEDEYKGEAVLGGKLIFPDGSDQDSAFHLPTIWGAFKEYFLAKGGSYFMYLPAHSSLSLRAHPSESKTGRQDLPEGSKPSKVEGLVMACLLIPKKVINKVGLLDEATFIFFEDIEYSRRLKKFAVPIYFVPKAGFVHHHGASTKKVGFKKSYEMLQESAIYYHGSFYYKLLWLVLTLGQKFSRVKTPVSRWME